MQPTASPRQVHGAMFTCLLLMASVLWIPAQLGVLATEFGFDARTLGWLASAELAGFLLGSIAASFVTSHALRHRVFVGVAFVVVANLALAAFAPAAPFVVMRPIASFGGGIAFAYALKLCAVSANPTRSFGIFTGFMSVAMILGFQTVGRFLDAQALFVAYAMLAAIAAVLHGFASRGLGSEEESAGAATRGAPPIVFVGLAAIALSFVGQGCIYSFLQTMGAAREFDASAIANAMSAWALFGVVGSFSAGMVPARLRRTLVIAVAMVAMFGGYFALYAPASVVWYTIGCAMGGFYWNFMLPLVLGLLAAIDTTGRGAAWGGSVSTGGAMLGPILAGALIVGDDYRAVAWASAALVAAGFVCVAWIENARAARAR